MMHIKTQTQAHINSLTPYADNTPKTASPWQILGRIDDALELPHPLINRFQQINQILIECLSVKAVWCCTIEPLHPVACGLVHTPLSVAPDARISLVDKTPPCQDWAHSDTLIAQVIANNRPVFPEPHQPFSKALGADLGDVLLSTFDTYPAAVIPLATQNCVLGILVIGQPARSEAVLSADTQQMLLYIASHIATALYQANLLETTRHHAETVETFNKISQAITSRLDIEDVLHEAMAGINTLLEVDAGSVLLLDEETKELYFRITLRGENRQVTAFRLQPGEGIAGWVMSHNQPAIVNTPLADARFNEKIDQAIGFRTNNVLCVPLRIQGKPIGVLEILNKRSGSFNEPDQQLLISLASVLSIALKNAVLFQDTQTLAEQNQTINQITAAVNVGHGLSETGRIIYQQFSRVFKLDHISLTLHDEAEGKVRQWIFGEYGCIEQASQVISLAGTRLAELIKTKQSLIDNDFSSAERPHFPDDEILLVDNVNSCIMVPLTTKNRPYGSLNMGSIWPAAYHKNDIQLLEKIASQLALVIEKALLIDMMELRTGELQLLNHLSEMLATMVDIGQLVDTIMNTLPRLLPGNVHGVVISGEEGAYAGLAVPYGFIHTERFAEDIFNTFLELREADTPVELISTKNIPGNTPVGPNWKAATSFSLPILTRRGAHGIIYVASGKAESFSDNFLRIFSLIVSQVSAAVENAHLFQQVEQERARLAAILTSSTDAVLVVNRRGRIVLDNPATWKILGVHESQVGRLLAESTDLKPLIELFESAMHEGNPTGEIPLRDGRTYFANLSPVSAGEAGIIGWVATMQDVSHFKELDELKNEFVSTVSHDLRSPLSGIMIASSLVSQAGDVSDEQQELLDVIKHRVTSMGQLIDDLLDVGHIEAGIDMEQGLCNLSPILDDVLLALTPQANDKNIRLNAVYPMDLPFITANANRLKQAIHNLVGNSIKYTPDNGQVTVKAAEHDQEIRIQIVDTGIGIPASDQPHIFEKFYRVKGEHMINIKGTGLGLSIVKGIIEQHHGRIWLESAQGEGSTFTVALPVAAPFPVL